MARPSEHTSQRTKQLSLQLSLTKYFPPFSSRTNSLKQFRPTNICNISTTQIFQPHNHFQYFHQLDCHKNHTSILVSQIFAKFPLLNSTAIKTTQIFQTHQYLQYLLTFNAKNLNSVFLDDFLSLPFSRTCSNR